MPLRPLDTAAFFRHQRPRTDRPERQSQMLPLRQQARRHVRPAKHQRNHQKEVVRLLKGWLLSDEHVNNPYPTETEKAELMDATGLSRKQLCNWFVNARKRVLQPRLVENQIEEETSKKRKAESQ